MKIEAEEGHIILKEVFNSITIETVQGKQLHLCLRDEGFDMKLGDDGKWHHITSGLDLAVKETSIEFANWCVAQATAGVTQIEKHLADNDELFEMFLKDKNTI